MPNDEGVGSGSVRPNDEQSAWDPERDPERLTSIMRRSGYTADQFARLMAEVAAAEAAEAERRGLPGLDKIRDTVTRQTVERWAKGQSPPKGWWGRMALIVIERLEQTLDSGFDVGQAFEPRPSGEVELVDSPTAGLVSFGKRKSWYVAAAVVAAAIAVGVSMSGGESEFYTATPVPGAIAVGSNLRSVPALANDDPTGPSGAGCDPFPAVAWWAASESKPLPDGVWFGRVLEIGAGASGGHDIVFDIACYYDQSGGGGLGARIEPGSPSMQSENAIALAIVEGSIVHWPGEEGVFQQTGVEAWLSGSAGSTDSGQLPVLCPSGWCSLWAYVNGGVVTEMVVVDFISG